MVSNQDYIILFSVFKLRFERLPSFEITYFSILNIAELFLTKSKDANMVPIIVKIFISNPC